MDTLRETHLKLIERIKTTFMRTILGKIDFEDRMIGIVGARGVGKTTLMLQKIKNTFGIDKGCMYVSLDNIYFSYHSLLEFTDEFYKNEGKYLFIDEIHKYANWSTELKNIYDNYPDLRIIFTGSSLLHIAKGRADLSRRAVIYQMEGLSFREFIEIETEFKFSPVVLEDILRKHEEICATIVPRIKPLAYFSDYLKFGYYPFYLESRKTYPLKLLNTINLILEVDIPFINKIDFQYIDKLKKLLYIVATSVPFQPNITKLSEVTGVSRNTILLYLDILKDAKLVGILKPKAAGYSYMVKPEKIYLNNPNLLNAIGEQNVNTGTLRETFFFNQLSTVTTVEYSPTSDFLINGKFTFEIGGKSKTQKQIIHMKDAYVAADMIEYGNANKIPLWLFGFLY